MPDCSSGCTNSSSIGSMPSNVLVLLIFSLLQLKALIYVVLVDLQRPTVHSRENPQKKIAPSYGVAGIGLVRTLSTLSMLFSVPPFALYYFYSNMNSDLSCQIESNSFPIWPVVLSFFVTSLLVTNFSRIYTRPQILKVFPKLSGNENVLVHPVYRGLYLTTVANHLKQLNGNGRGHVHGCDNYVWKHSPTSFEWAQENCEREGVANIVTLKMGEYSAAKYVLPYENNSFELLVVPFISNEEFINASMSADRMAKKRKVALVMNEVSRVLKPGGQVIFIDTTLHLSTITEVGEQCGFQSIQLHAEKLWFSLFPAKAVTMVKPSTDSASRNFNANDNGGSKQINIIDDRKQRPLLDDNSREAEENEGENEVNPVVRSKSSTSFIILKLVFLLVVAGMFAFVVWVTTAYWCDYLFPSEVPKTTQFSSLMISILLFFPLTTYFSYLEIHQFTEKEDATFHSTLVMVIRVLVGITVNMTLLNFVFWLPTFIVDYIFHKSSESTLNNLNIAVNILIFYGLIKLGPRALAFYEKMKKKSDAITANLKK